MSTITGLSGSPLLNLGYKSPNGFGVDVNFYSDPLGGLIAFASRIPNPPMGERYVASGDPVVFPLTPHKPVCCTSVPPPDDPVVTPEPGTWAVMLVCLCVGLVIGWRRG